MTLVSIVHIVLALVLIVLVLLQDSKGGAGMFGGGGGNTLFGASGGADFLTRSTRYVAILFSATCIGLAYMTSSTKSSVLDNYAPSAKTETSLPAEPVEKSGDTSDSTKESN